MEIQRFSVKNTLPLNTKYILRDLEQQPFSEP